MKAQDTRDGVKLVHVMTVPQSLSFLTGQARFMKERGFDLHAVASPGPALGRFGRYEYHNSDQCIARAMEVAAHVRAIAQTGAPARPNFA